MADDTRILSRNLTGDLHSMMVAMADYRLDEMTDAEILALCPKDYGSVVTNDHLNLVWDRLYSELERLDDFDIYSMYENYLDILEEKNNKLLEHYDDEEEY